MPVNYRFKQRRGTAAEWTLANSVLAEGEIGVEIDNDPAQPDRFKIGDGVTSWGSLPYAALDAAHLHTGTYAETRGEMHDAFAGKPDGPLTTSDSGHDWTPFAGADGAGLSIIGGKLTRVRPTTTPKAAYASVTLAAPVTRIGGRFTFEPYTGDVNQGSVIMLVPLTDFSASYPFLPPLSLHVSITPSYWDLNVFESIGGASATPVSPKLADGYFSKTQAPVLVADGTTEYEVDVSRIGTTVYLDIKRVSDGASMLDGIRAITDDRFASYAGLFAIWENYINGNPDYTHGSLGGWTRVWADSAEASNAFYASSIEARYDADTRAKAARTQAIARTSPTITTWTGNDGMSLAIPTATTKVATADGTKNGVAVGASDITFPVTPPESGSGEVRVHVEVYIGGSNATSSVCNVFLSLIRGATTYGFKHLMAIPPQVATTPVVNGVVSPTRFSYTTKVTGLTLANGQQPGVPIDLTLQFKASVLSVARLYMASNASYEIHIESTPLP